MRPSTRCLLALLACVAGVSAQTAGRVSAVRVYRGQALVTRTVEFTAQAGPQELVVGELPERLLPESLYATGDGGLVVRAVRYRAEAVAEEPREEVRLLDQEIAAKQEEIERIQAERDVLEQQGQYLDKLENFVAPTASAELSKGVLDAEALMKMTQFAFEQRAQIATKRLEYGRQEKQAQEALTVLGRKRQALVGSDSRLRRQAVVFLEAPKAGPARLDLNYLVSGVGWSPAYVARLNGAMDKLMLEYHAVVTQFSGEDWTNVELVLSTGSVAMQANTPMLAPLYVGLTEAGGDGADDAREYAAQRRELEEQIRGTNQAAKPSAPAGRPGAAGGAGGPAGPHEAAALPVGETPDVIEANILAAQLQRLELTAADEAIRGSRRAGGDSESLAVDYPMPGQVSLQSRNDQQMFRIAAVELQPSFHYSAVPLLSDFVYRAVEARNTSPLALLPGPYSAYVEGVFAGRGQLPLTASGQGLALGFGTESRLRVTRVLEEKQTAIRGGNKQLRYTYRFRLQNFMDRPATVRVWDRLPQTPSEQVTVALVEPGAKLSEDPLYQEIERPRGLLRWDIEVPAGASGAQAKSFAYTFQLEFDKNYDIGALPAELEERMRRDLQSLQERKAM